MIFIIAVTSFSHSMSAEFIYLFMREFRLYVFHSTVTEGPTDYLNDKQRWDEFFWPYLWLEILKEQMCLYVCVCLVNNIVNSPESTSILMYLKHWTSTDGNWFCYAIVCCVSKWTLNVGCLCVWMYLCVCVSKRLTDMRVSFLSRDCSLDCFFIHSN